MLVALGTGPIAKAGLKIRWSRKAQDLLRRLVWRYAGRVRHRTNCQCWSEDTLVA
ncbi:hypothetical protein DPMN_049187 [Dreissena polymorpha]|uniref:Uncharacterized protein n=1 Tax=Dreissena polymorpha TaxID=45954 RepID=A0A9D4DD07_DREPO|nr:hypothetical protein DPMN_049187 [Dreissena polymorpha]